VASLIIYTGLSQGTNVPYPSVYFLDVVSVGLLCSSMCYPIYLTYRYQRERRIPTSNSNRGSMSWYRRSFGSLWDMGVACECAGGRERERIEVNF